MAITQRMVSGRRMRVKKSSTWRELTAVWRVLQAFADNINCLTCAYAGSQITKM